MTIAASGLTGEEKMMERLTDRQNKNLSAVATKINMDFAFDMGKETWDGVVAILPRVY